MTIEGIIVALIIGAVAGWLAGLIVKGVGFGLGLALLGFIFFPILGFGSAQYQGPSAGTMAPGTAPQAA